MNSHANLAKYMIAIVSALIVMFPSIQQVLVQPIQYDWMLYGFFACAIGSFIVLSIALYLTTIDQNSKPERALGIGNIFGFISFLILVIYFVINFYADRVANPSIDYFLLSPVNPKEGETVSIQAKVSSENSDNIDFSWKYNGIEFGNKEIAYWRVPYGKNIYKIDICINNQHKNTICEKFQINVFNKINGDINESDKK